MPGPAPDAAKTLFGRRLDELIDRLNFSSIAEFERCCGITKGLVSKYRKGMEPSLGAIKKIVQATGCDVNELIGEGAVDADFQARARGRLIPPQVDPTAECERLARLHRLLVENYTEMMRGVVPYDEWDKVALVVENTLLAQLARSRGQARSASRDPDQADEAGNLPGAAGA